MAEEDKQELALLWDACLFLESGHCTQGSHVLKVSTTYRFLGMLEGLAVGLTGWSVVPHLEQCYSQRYDKSFLGLVHFRSVMMNDGDYLLGVMAVQPLPLPIDLLSPRPQGLQPNTSSLSDDSSGDESEAVISLTSIPPSSVVPTTTATAAPMSTSAPSWGSYTTSNAPSYPSTISAPLPQSTALPSYQQHPPPAQATGPNPHPAFPSYYYMDQSVPTAGKAMWAHEAGPSQVPYSVPAQPHQQAQHPFPNLPSHMQAPPQHAPQPPPPPQPMEIGQGAMAQGGMPPGAPWGGPVTEELLLTWEALEALQSES